MIHSFRICPNCDYFCNTKEEDLFCPDCGSNLLDKCPNCGKEINYPYAKFCKHCGKPYPGRIDKNKHQKF
ncbi:MAG: hypothetical protein CO129_02495 [Ignavibacteriales bacterium CG_4_9_14_3_um_filter_34_10]|nr:MAG: hypothetical protein CO129_02495 [Ignavibacteriales bacterium CG_4_9_14_3_um_filter_34_10]